MKRQRLKGNNDNYKSSKDSDESNDETELLIRKPTHKEIPTVERIIQEGDTLQALSIRYHCPIAELKRLNNIHKENEIYARTKIKVPARPFTIPSVHESGNNSPIDAIVDQKTIDANVIKDKLAVGDADDAATSVNAVIFNSNIIAKSPEPSDSFFDETLDDEEVRLLPNEEPHAITANSWSCNGADGDISVICLILCVFVIIVAIPFIYVYYVVEHPEEFHHINKHHEHS